MSAIKIIDFEAGQKLIDPKANLLWEGFDYDGLKLDLYGECDGENCVIEYIAPAHTRIDIRVPFSDRTIKYLESQCINQFEQAAAREEYDRKWQKQFGTQG